MKSVSTEYWRKNTVKILEGVEKERARSQADSQGGSGKRDTVLNTAGAESTSRESKGSSGYGRNAKQDQGPFSESSKDVRISIKETLFSPCCERTILKQN